MASAKQTATSLAQCAACKCDVGKEAGKIPFFVDDSASTTGERAKHEAFCPQDFVYVRSPREPERWRPGQFVPVKCSSCGLESVSIGRGSCMQCGSRAVVVLGPKAGVS